MSHHCGWCFAEIDMETYHVEHRDDCPQKAGHGPNCDVCDPDDE